MLKCSRSTFDNLELLKNGLPGALVTALILGVHEVSHIIVAKKYDVKLGVPYFVPSWQVKYIASLSLILDEETTYFLIVYSSQITLMKGLMNCIVADRLFWCYYKDCKYRAKP